jgi:hypothetical protein
LRSFNPSDQRLLLCWYVFSFKLRSKICFL